jgi:hypothetical protein
VTPWDPQQSTERSTEPTSTYLPKAQRTIIIDRPVDQVFAFFSDPGNDLNRRHHATRKTLVGG